MNKTETSIAYWSCLILSQISNPWWVQAFWFVFAVLLAIVTLFSKD